MAKTTRLRQVLLLGAMGALGPACDGSPPQQMTKAAPGANAEAATGGTAAPAAPDNGQRANTAFGDPLPGLSSGELARFQAGKEEFESVEAAQPDGLGPVFNDTSCVACHGQPATGGASGLIETRFGRVTASGFDPLVNLGGSLIQKKGIGMAGDCNFTGEVVPPEANVSSGRRTTALFGLGLVDAVPESALQALAAEESQRFPGEAGRIGLVHDIARNRQAVGRFGWKDQVPTLHQFAGDAYLNEMGITSPEFPKENCPQGDCSLLDRCNPVKTLNDDGSGPAAFQDFMSFLAPPPRGPTTNQVDRGKAVFETASCTHCHTPTMVTGASDTKALSHVPFHPYSDFLLHDMGSLGDGIEVGAARGGEFRTAPLWGLHNSTAYLHDGSAASPEAAIRAHDGQAKKARDAFLGLSAADRQALLDFLESL